MFERTERAAHRYTSNFRTSLILTSFAALNYVTDKDPDLTTLCGTLAVGFGLRGLYEMDKQGQLRKKLRQIKRNLYSFWEKAPDLRVSQHLSDFVEAYSNRNG